MFWFEVMSSIKIKSIILVKKVFTTQLVQNLLRELSLQSVPAFEELLPVPLNQFSGLITLHSL